MDTHQPLSAIYGCSELPLCLPLLNAIQPRPLPACEMADRNQLGLCQPSILCVTHSKTALSLCLAEQSFVQFNANIAILSCKLDNNIHNLTYLSLQGEL